MAPGDVEAEIDKLYRLPPEEFTPARNALAKQLQGERAREVKALRKPNLTAWAVNQLYWISPDLFGRLRKAADRLRTAHAEAMSGRPIDLQTAGVEHREALKRAVARIHDILREAGRPINVETTRAVAQTLEALRSDDPPGRLDRPLEPEGFDALKSIAPSEGSARRSGAGRDDRDAITEIKRTAASADRVSITEPKKPAAFAARASITESKRPTASAARAQEGGDRGTAKPDPGNAEEQTARERARAFHDARKALAAAERSLAASRRVAIAAHRASKSLVSRLEAARRVEVRAQKALDRAREARIRLEEKAARAQAVETQATAAAATAERAVREAREARKPR